MSLAAATLALGSAIGANIQSALAADSIVAPKMTELNTNDKINQPTRIDTKQIKVDTGYDPKKIDSQQLKIENTYDPRTIDARQLKIE